MMGPQDDFFSNEAQTVFLKGPYRIGLQSDRMGYRLEGPAIAHVAGFNIVSDGIAPGSIQVPGSGQPIVLLADRQSTGGYPKIATLLSVDIRRLVQRRPDEPITFVAVTPAEVDAILREDRAATAALLAAILPVSTGDLYDSGRLLGLNLIDGFIAGEA
jgi:allophanate hydrolase subunit 2